MSSVTRPDSDEPSSPDLDPHVEDPAQIEGRARWLLLAGVAAAVFVADLLTKWWAVVALDDRDIDVIWTLRFKLIHNTGSAFSLAQGQGVLLSVAALAAVAILLVTGRRTGRLWSLVAIGLIIGGALGNLADRAFREGDGFMGGGVVDFIDLQWWPIFNIADMGVVIGAGLLIVTTGSAESRSDR